MVLFRSFASLRNPEAPYTSHSRLSLSWPRSFPIDRCYYILDRSVRRAIRDAVGHLLVLLNQGEQLVLARAQQLADLF